MPRITKDPTERRQEILDTALKLFWEKGYEKTSMTEIAQAMQVAQGLCYRYLSICPAASGSDRQRIEKTRSDTGPSGGTNADLSGNRGGGQCHCQALPWAGERKAPWAALHGDMCQTSAVGATVVGEGQ